MLSCFHALLLRKCLLPVLAASFPSWRFGVKIPTMLDQLKNLKSLAGLFGNADEIRQRFEQVQAELARKTVEAEAGAGAVRVVVNGKFEIISVHLDQPLLKTLAGEGNEADTQMIEDLIASATNAGLQKAQALARDEIAKVTGGLSLPGIDKLMGG